MRLTSGTSLGPYEIIEPLGEGGMGQVWKARDTRLNRFVAIKTSHQAFNERFEREAHAIAALNHPHVCSLYDVGPDYLVMEYVEVKEAGAALEAGIPQRLFTAPIDYGWDVTPDGKRFLLSLAFQAKVDAQAPITVVLNWPALLNK